MATRTWVYVISIPIPSLIFSSHSFEPRSCSFSNRLCKERYLMMKSTIMGLLIMVSFLLVAERGNGRLLMKNNQFVFPHNPSGVDPNPDFLVDDGSQVNTVGNHVEKNAVQYDQERSHRSFKSSNGATKDQKLSLRISVGGQKAEKIKAKGVFNLLPKGRVTRSGSSPLVNSMVTEHELSTSKNSPGVGHMQMIRSKSKIIRADVVKSDHSQGDHHVQPKMSNKGKLGSTPSPGGGNR